MTITEFLEARISEDEAFAHKVPGMHFSTWNRSWEAGFRDLVLDDGVDGRYVRLPESMDEHICRHDPARVLAECAAERSLIGLLQSDSRDPHNAMRREWADEILRAFATVHADHPDYDVTWRNS